MSRLRKIILNTIDFFYIPFKRFLPLSTFRYAVCGGGNTLLDIILYFISFHYILHEQMLNLGFIAFKPHIASLLMSFVITFPIGFLLSKYIVFPQSAMRTRIQLSRYMLIVAINLLLNYIFLKVLVEYLNFFPTVSRIFATAFIITFSYLSQKHFTFRQQKDF